MSEEGVFVVKYKRVGGDRTPIVPDLRGGLVEDFATWLRSKDRRPFFYHRGFLPIDRVTNYELDVVATAALLASGSRLPDEPKADREARVDLVQRRIAPGVYNYLAQKRRGQ